MVTSTDLTDSVHREHADDYLQARYYADGYVEIARSPSAEMAYDDRDTILVAEHTWGTICDPPTATDPTTVEDGSDTVTIVPDGDTVHVTVDGTELTLTKGDRAFVNETISTAKSLLRHDGII